MSSEGGGLIALKEITPEKLEQKAKEREAGRLARLNRLSAERLGQERVEAEADLRNVNTRCQLRAMELRWARGMGVAGIAEWLKVSEGTVLGWLEAPVEVELTGGLIK